MNTSKKNETAERLNKLEHLIDCLYVASDEQGTCLGLQSALDQVGAMRDHLFPSEKGDPSADKPLGTV